MGLSRNKVAVPEGAAGSPPFYGEYHFGAWHGVVGVVPAGAGRAGVERSLRPVRGGYGHAVGFPGRHGPRRGVGVQVPAVAGCPRVGLVGRGVAWWFENWIVDASGPCRCCTVVVCLY